MRILLLGTGSRQITWHTHAHAHARRYVNGVHYSRTLEAWLAKHDACKAQLMPLMAKTYGGKHMGVVWCVAARWV